MPQPEGDKEFRFETERFSFNPDHSVDEAGVNLDDLRKVDALFGVPTLLNELWQKGLIFLVNSVLHNYGYALGVDVTPAIHEWEATGAERGVIHQLEFRCKWCGEVAWAPDEDGPQQKKACDPEKVPHSARRATGLFVARTSDPEGIWFDEATIRQGRQKLLAAGLIGDTERFTQQEIEAALPALEAMLKEDPKASVWALPLLLRNRQG